MKKIFAALLIMAQLFVFASCGAQVPTEEDIDYKMWYWKSSEEGYYWVLNFSEGEGSMMVGSTTDASHFEKWDGAYTIKKDGIHFYRDDGKEWIFKYRYEDDGELILIVTLDFDDGPREYILHDESGMFQKALDDDKNKGN